MKVLRFTASWCQPCKMLAPMVEEAKGDTTVEIIDIDTDDGMALAAKMKVRGVPTLIMVDEENEEIKRHVGMTTDAALVQWFQS